MCILEEAALAGNLNVGFTKKLAVKFQKWCDLALNQARKAKVVLSPKHSFFGGGKEFFLVLV